MAEAVRLFGLLRTHGEVTKDAFCENLVAAALGGTLMSRGNKGFDVRHPALGRIEVRSRMLGTDGDKPRITLRCDPVEACDWLVAVRITPDFRLHEGWMFAARSLQRLYARYRRAKNPVAHVPWNVAVALEGADDITGRLGAVLAGVDDA